MVTSGLGWLTLAVILTPLAGATVALLAGLYSAGSGWPITVVTLVVTTALAIPVVIAASAGSVRYAIGAIPAQYGIELVIDAVAAVLVVLTLVVLFGAVAHLRRAGPRGNAFHAGILLLAGGTLGVTMAGDLFNLFVFLEISALASYALIASADDRRATYAAFKYLLLGTVGASLYLLGVAYVFIATGTLNMRAAAASLAAVGHADPVVVASFVFIGVGLAIKIAMFPLHTWLADAHAAAPDAISAIVSGLLPAVAVYALARIVFAVYSVGFLAANPAFTTLLVVGGLVTLFAGSVFALLQREIKLLLAYSTVAQMGLAVVGVALATEQSVFGATVQLLGHGIVKAALFLLAGIIALVYGARRLDEYAGLAKRSPYLAGAFTLLGLSLVGLPPTAGFMGKYYIVLGAIEAGAWLVAGAILASTLLTLAYVVPIIDRLYFHPYDGGPPVRRQLPRASALAVAVGVGLSIGIGLLTVPLGDVVTPAIEVLLQ